MYRYGFGGINQSTDGVASQVCSDSQVLISITQTYSTDSDKENIELWEGEEGEGILIYFENGKNYTSQEVYNSLCVSRSLLTLVLTSYFKLVLLNCRYGDGWSTGSRVLIKGESDIVVANVTLDAFSHRAIYLDCFFTI